MGGDPSGDFRTRWGWYITIDELTNGDPFKETEVYGWSVIRFLNRLAYLKERNFVMSQNK